MDEQLPRGFRFKPSELDLLFYLEKFAMNKSLPENKGRIIVEENLYETNEWQRILSSDGLPWQKTANHNGNFEKKQSLYLVTKLVMKEDKNAITRTAGQGKWRVKSGRRKVMNEKNDEILGTHREFRLETANDGEFTMHEYSLSPAKAKANDYVICIVKKAEAAADCNNSGEKRIQEVQETEKIFMSLDRLPKGFRFNPTDEDLMFCLQKAAERKLLGEYEGVITRVKKVFGEEEEMSPLELFGDRRQWQKIVAASGEISREIFTLYVVTKRERNSARDAGCYIWDIKNKVKLIKKENSGEVIGTRRLACLKPKKGVKKTDDYWSMHLYQFLDEAKTDVLCRITKYGPRNRESASDVQVENPLEGKIHRDDDDDDDKVLLTWGNMRKRSVPK